MLRLLFGLALAVAPAPARAQGQQPAGSPLGIGTAAAGPSAPQVQPSPPWPQPPPAAPQPTPPPAAPSLQPSSPTLPAPAAPAPRRIEREPLVLSGAILTPTAYRAGGRRDLGPSADINAAYYIGRLYGRNALNWTTEKTNFIDRVGVWFLSVDGKMLVQREGRRMPAFAAGAEGVYTFRDAPQPNLQTPGVAVKVTAPTTRALSSAYLVASKKLLGQIWSAGYERGNAGNRVGFLSEFLAPQALTFSGHPGKKTEADDVYFANSILFPTSVYPIKVEYMKFAGAPLHPTLLNLRIGSLLHLNFDISYLKFKGGYDILGMFGFRYSLYPKQVR